MLFLATGIVLTIGIAFGLGVLDFFVKSLSLGSVLIVLTVASGVLAFVTTGSSFLHLSCSFSDI